MLRRISTIKNIGAFTQCNAGPVSFSKITLIYGRNTYGKTTLGDIFLSLKTGDSSLLTSRKSIPDNGSGQEIKINFSTDDENENQGIAHYRNGHWVSGLRTSHRLAVYDDSFYHTHVFSARNLSRETKENFSDFVLGEHGVEKAQQLEGKIVERKNAVKAKADLEKQAFSGIQDIPEFVRRPLVADFDATSAALDKARSDYSILNRQRKESAAIKARSLLTALPFHLSFIENANGLNSTLTAILENRHEAAKRELANHIDRCFTRVEGAEQWIQQGLGYLKGNNCGFCGQAITPQVNELLDMYRQCFDDQYSRHEGFVKSSIKRFRSGLNLNLFDSISKTIESAELIIQAYPEFSEGPAQKVVASLQSLHCELLEKIEALRPACVESINQFDTYIHMKLATPDKAVQEVDVSRIQSGFELLSTLVEKINPLVEQFNGHANQLKASLDEQTVVTELNRLQQLGEGLAADFKRFELNDACIEHQQLDHNVSVLNAEIPRLRQALKDEQEAYLAEYFSRINDYFQKFGSRDFTLEIGVSNQGKKPVNFFKVLFRGQAIAEQCLDKVFSESDRRALSLALFFSSLDGLDQQELAKTVVVLDDPVTSFDNERVSRIHSAIEQLSNRCEQVILQSHFKEGLANFLNVQGYNRDDVKVIEIIKSEQSSGLQEVDPEVFTKNAYLKHADNLIDFVERRTDSVHPPARVFLEDAVQIRFSKQMREHGIDERMFSDRIDRLLACGIISSVTAERIHRWRIELNPEHHVNLDDDIDNRRHTIAQLMDFVFHQLVPA